MQKNNQDLLSRLENSQYFHSRLESAISAARSRKTCSVLLVITIDEFSHLLATLGKASTNLVLNDISNFLKSSVHHPFTASKLADNEFGLLLYGASHSDGQNLTEYLNARLKTTLNCDKQANVTLKIRIGLVIINDSTGSAKECLNCAKLGLQSHSDLPNGDKLIQELIKSQHFQLHFQPVMALNDAPLARYEVLLRHQSDAQNQQDAIESLVHLAEIHNLGSALDETILHSLVTRYINPDVQHPEFFVHLCSSTLSAENFLIRVSQILDNYQLSPDAFVFQIKAATLSENHQLTLKFVSKIQALGIKLCITEFGTFTDPAPLLETFNPTYVKLDPLLIENLLFSRQQQRVLTKLIRAIHGKECRAIATRIETLDLIPALWDLDIDLIQGFCLQKPDADITFSFPREERIVLPASTLH